MSQQPDVDQVAGALRVSIGLLVRRLRQVQVDGELTLTTLHPGVTANQVQDATGWELKVARHLHTTPAATAEELAALRELINRG